MKCFIGCREGNCEVDVCARQKNTLPILFDKKKTQSGLYWYARFWDEKTQAYNTVRSTGIPLDAGTRLKRPAAEVRGSVFMYLEAYYNRVRIHSALDYVAPEGFNSGQAA
ncbi:MAG: hypothetical protein LBP80_10470 [Treponema sp.]|nr:hypothetical protein [Treponema sp.]